MTVMPYKPGLRSTLSISVALASLIFSGTSFAEDGTEGKDKGWNGYVSLGGAFVPDYEGSADYMPAPVFAGKLGYNEYYMEFRGPEARINVVPADILGVGLEAGPAFAYRFGRSDVKNSQVDALRDIEGSAAFGAFVKLYKGDLFQQRDELGLEFVTLTGVGELLGVSDYDLFNKVSDGTTATLAPYYRFTPLQRVFVSVKPSVTYASGDYNDTYFSVDTGNALRSGLSRYKASGGIKDVGLTVTSGYQITEGWGVTGTLGLTQLVGDAADSPIVKDTGSATQGLVSLGVNYRF